MRFGLDISPAGSWGRPDQIAELAAVAEKSGWDGVVFCEDYLCFPHDGARPDEPVATFDVWITLALVAEATSRITLGTMVTPLPARHPPSIAIQALTVDHLSRGRLVLGVGLGDPEPANVAALGQTGTLPERAASLDESLEVITRLWSGDRVSFQGRHHRLHDAQFWPRPVTQPRIPIWIGGALTRPGPRRRALRWDGACLYRIPPTAPQGWEDVTPDDVRTLRTEAAQRADAGHGFVIAVGGRERATTPDQLNADYRYIDALAAAGTDWWHEYVPPRLPYDQARRIVEAGPMRADNR